MGWASVETARCAKCAVYTEKADLVFGANGHAYCVTCGLPAAAKASETVTEHAWVRPSWKMRTRSWWTARSLRSQKRAFYTKVGVMASPWPPAYRNVIQYHVRYIIGAILLVTLSFPIAACVSQL